MRILSIDGGGVRGLIPALLVAEIEHRTGRPIHESFDLVAGTSAGGQIALALTAPAASGGPRWTAAAFADHVTSLYGQVFDHPSMGLLSALRTLTQEKYPAARLESALAEVLGETMLSEALVEVLVTSYEVESASPHFFTRQAAREGDDHTMAFVARATSAAPTYFEPATVTTQSGRRTFIDGGVFANNPTVCAFAHAMSLGDDEDGMTVVSLGTGAISEQWAFDEVRDWGLANWIRPVLDITSHGANAAIDWQMRSILPAGRYFRLSPEMSDGRSSLDDASPETVEALADVTRRLIVRNDAVFDAIAASVSL